MNRNVQSRIFEIEKDLRAEQDPARRTVLAETLRSLKHIAFSRTLNKRR